VSGEEAEVDPGTRDNLDQAVAAIAEESGAALHACPRVGQAVRRVVLRDERDERGTRFEAAQVDDDGALRVVGHDTGSGVSDYFGTAISSYEWVYVVPSSRVGALARVVGAERGDDVLDALASYYQQNGGRVSQLLRSPEVAAEFSNWHS
jgi:hypothetical protein